MNQSQTLRILVAEDEKETRDYFVDAIKRLGHPVVGTVSNGRELIEQCQALRPDLVLADVKMPEMDGLQAAHVINTQMPTPFIILSAHHDSQLLQNASAGDYVVGYLVKPVTESTLKTTIAVGMTRFQRYQAINREAHDLRQALDERKVIEKAKGIVMLRLQLNEEEAFRRLRRRASDQNMKLVEVSRQIVNAEEIFHNLDREGRGG